MEPNEAGAARGRPPNPGPLPPYPRISLLPFLSGTHDSRCPELLQAAVTFIANLGAEGTAFSVQNQCCTDSLSQFWGEAPVCSSVLSVFLFRVSRKRCSSGVTDSSSKVIFLWLTNEWKQMLIQCSLSANIFVDIHLILTPTLWGRHYHFPRFMDEDTEAGAERVRHLPRFHC